MSELYQIILTSSFTIIGGVIIYVVGQIISRFFIEPIHIQKKIIGEIDDVLGFYANVYCNPGIPQKEKINEASNRFRQLATLLKSKAYLIPWYNLFAKIRIVLKSDSIKEASEELIGLSNSMHRESIEGLGNLGILNSDRANKIRKLLKLKF